MKNYIHLITAFIFVTIAFSTFGCDITEECGREGLTVYTNWEGQNYTSVCVDGFWVDTALDASDSTFMDVISRHQGCKAVGCYKNGVEDCECLEVDIARY